MDFETVEKREKDDVVIWCPDVVPETGSRFNSRYRDGNETKKSDRASWKFISDG